ncbi:hypothetical protein HYW54_03620 [Candidatus Gottesmanbacteria bacterium]|nr:hypothetical protein [Candidatus Gottesmanbacteria bacterium]
MADLNERQIQILKAVIDEYINTAEPVGSDTLDKKYNLGVSPATIRNEMVKLTKMGYLNQPHTSAGRTPTQTGLKFYVGNLMKSEELPLTQEVGIKHKLWDYRKEMDKVLREATKALAEYTKAMSVAATDEGDLYAAGLGNILDMPEFYDIDFTKHLLSTLDEHDYWWQMFDKGFGMDEKLHILIGEELGRQYLENCGLVYINFRTPHNSGAIGIVGPIRLNYPHIVPVVRYMGSLVDEIAKNW